MKRLLKTRVEKVFQDKEFQYVLPAHVEALADIAKGDKSHSGLEKIANELERLLPLSPFNFELIVSKLLTRNDDYDRIIRIAPRVMRRFNDLMGRSNRINPISQNMLQLGSEITQEQHNEMMEVAKASAMAHYEQSKEEEI